MSELLLKSKEVRIGIFAYMYASCIEIGGKKYLGYSMTEAIKRWRKANPIRKK